MNRFRALICRSYLWLALGLALFFFSHGRWTVPICSWFAFVFLIRFHRTSSRPWLGMVALWVGMSACLAFMYDGLLPVQGMLFYAACLLLGAIWVVPFLADWLLCRRLDGFAATFVWPSLMVTVNYFLAAYLPNLAHSQIEYLSLIQVVSITGMGGLVFLVYWFAGTVNRIWEFEFNWSLSKRDGAVFLGVLVLVLLYGETRLAFAIGQDETVQAGTMHVAMVNLQRNRFRGPDKFEPKIVDELFAASKQAADAGANVIAWSEANADIPLDYEDDLVALGKTFAKDNNVFLFMSFRSFSTGWLNENKTIGVSPEGRVVVEYLKSNPIPFLEAATRQGNGMPAIAEIHGVRTGHVICYDMDFPSFIRQAGRRGIDILFAPSSDWREIRFLHAASARFRAVENGCSLVRPTIQGLSIATDPYGRMLAYHDYYSDAPRLTMVAVPSRGVRTFYAMFGDVFSLGCIALFVGLIGLAYRRKRIQ